ncbi:hypothetical protein ACQP0C_27235 [Nocardia sp. CA-129566]|uniref:hypothetical protein n=1 Tax=Nocardia sp. CA-129566 TaxID=3239976 RepID=UPI003D9956D8
MSWHLCKVDSVGPQENGEVLIKLDDEGTDWAGPRWFKTTDAVRKDMLSVALAAIQSGLPVRTMLAATAEYSRIDRLYIQRPA